MRLSNEINLREMRASASWVRLLICLECEECWWKGDYYFLQSFEKAERDCWFFFLELTVRKKDNLERDECVWTTARVVTIDQPRRDGGTVKSVNQKLKTVTVVWLSARYGTGSVGFAPLTIFKMTTRMASCIFSAGGECTARNPGPPAQCCNFATQPKTKVRKIRFSKCGYLCSSLCLKKVEKSKQKSWELCKYVRSCRI